MPTPLTDADKVLRNDTGKDIVEKLDDIAQALGVGVNADQINYDNTESGLEATDVQDAIDEVKEITDNLDNKLDGLTDIISTASGTIVTFNDGGDNIPVKSLVTEITATQAGTGTPSPDNIRAITGFDNVSVSVIGKNLLPMFTSTTASGVNYTVDNNGIVTASGQATGNSRVAQYLYLPSGTYTLSGASSGSTVGVGDIYVTRVSDGVVLARDYTGSTDTDKQFTLTQTERLYIACRFANAAMTSSTTRVFYPQIERSETPSNYAPYKSTTHTITLPETIYGGSAELVNGNGTKTWIMLNFSDLNFSASNPSSHIFRGDYNGTYKNNIQFSPNPYTATTCITEHYEAMAWQPISGSDHGKFALNDYGTDARFVFVDFNYSTQADFETARNNDKIIVPLVNPIPFTFTDAKIPTLSGENNIYSNTGDVSVEYFNSKADWLADLIKAMSAT